MIGELTIPAPSYVVLGLIDQRFEFVVRDTFRGLRQASPLTYGRIGLKGKNRNTTTHMPTHKLTAEILHAAIVGFEEQKRRIDVQITELRAMLSGGRTATAAAPGGSKGKRRKMSAAGRARIAEAQRKRWAEAKKTSSPVAPEVPKAKRKLSAAGKRAISEANKKRWARVRAEAAKEAKAQQTPAAKRAPAKARKAVKRRQTAAATPPAVSAATE